jgi:valyl-tRNA synthetase
MEINKTYSPADAEKKWYPYWLEKKFFRSVPDNRTPYTIVIPPPNVTGVLHMGHMLNNTIQDVLIRSARMKGYNACWVPGTDHASIATEAKVVKLLADQGIKKSDITREEFLKHAWTWKEKYGGIILEQLKQLGASCDWERTRFTMEEALSEAVIDVFIDLHKKGYIYRGVRMVNWDPQGLTAVSDEEVIHKETTSRLVYVKYKIENSDDHIVVATTRPETIMGDTAVCVNPNDKRYTNLKGKRVIVPIVNRAVPLIFDEYVDPEFGTGALKVTPAHDINDFNLGQKYSLPVIDALTPDGKISEAAGAYVGMDRFAARKHVTKDLQEQGLVEKIEDIKNKVGYSERTDAVIEPKLSMQWFLKMDKVSKPALDAVMNGDVNLIPDKFINTYRHWMENVHDWCISRQLWWGQRIPAWYDNSGNTVVAKTKDEAIELLKNKNASVNASDVKQDEDVLDTWFSSWLWPMTVFDPDIIKNGWEKANAELKYYYPTNDLVTAPEILFFWVARMIIAGEEYTGKKPFTNVYLTGIVRDKLGRKMSKSLGNSPDPLDLIKKHGADGVRVGMLLSSPAGNDLLFDESYCEQGRNFANKVWNAFRLLKGFEVGSVKQQPAAAEAVSWFGNRLNEQLGIINEHYRKYRMSDALMTTYKLVWDDFCSWYLEAIKPEFIDGKGQPIDKATYDASMAYLEDLLKIMHPFMPFITEEIWHLISERKEMDCIIVASWPSFKEPEKKSLDRFEFAKEVIVNLRNIRAKYNLSPKQHLKVSHEGLKENSVALEVVTKLANSSFSPKGKNGANSVVEELFMSGGSNYYVAIDTDKDKVKQDLLKDLDYNKGFLKSVQSKLANEKFVANAKAEIIAVERKKESDALQKIKTIEEQLSALRN